MGRILGIDFGRKRTGVAVTDTLQIVASGVATLPTHTVLQWIKDYVAREPVDRIVVGKPTQLNGEPSESMRYLEPFLVQLHRALPQMEVVMYDERFTSSRVISRQWASRSWRKVSAARWQIRSSYRKASIS